MFVTSTGLSGTWPEPPKYWSYSSLAEVRSCPRRYALKHATYAELWDRPGYPDRITESSIVGAVVHEGIEEVLRALKVAGCASVADVRAIDVLRQLGGYSLVVSSAAQRVLARFDDNPRMNTQLVRLRERVDRRIPEMRRAIQALVSRMSVGVDEGPTAGDIKVTGPRKRTRLAHGVHPEVTLIAENERVLGRIDLLTVRANDADVLDFKTGQAADHHSDQVILYGLLWILDRVANPDRRPVGALTIAYVSTDQAVPIPDDWNAVRRDLEAQVELADRALSMAPPPAVPSTECWYCPVRQICDEYWQSAYVDRAGSSPFSDVEMVVVDRNGPKSWSAWLADGPGDTLLRTATEAEQFDHGQRLRILDAVIEQQEDDRTVVTANAGSEIFRADSS